MTNREEIHNTLVEKNKEKVYNILVNRVIHLNKMKDILWDYHPENPNGINVVEEFDRLVDEIEKLEEQIKDFKII